MRTLLATLLLAAATLAQSVESVQPACAAPKDPVLICGSGFAAEPTVLFGDAEAEVLRSHESKILCRVPEGLEAGSLTIDVDGATIGFDVLAAGSPVVLHVSTEKATPGTRVVVIGARLGGATVDFVAGDAVVDTVELRGRRHIGWFQVPEDLATGAYTLVITNEAGLTSGPCSPALEIVEPGDPAIESIEPEEQLPGRNVVIHGSNLGPLGFARVAWTAGDQTLRTFGFSNGFDKIYSWVPYGATPGGTYDVVVRLRDGSETAPFSYDVGSPPPPKIDHLEYDAGPAGSMLGIFGEGLAAFGAPPAVHFTRDGESTEAQVIFAAPGFGVLDDQIVVRVPDVEDGDYDVTVTVGDQTSNAVVFTVEDLPLAVTSMSPDHQGADGPVRPVEIQGSGFGVFDPVRNFAGALGGSASVRVTWDDGGGDPLRGIVLFHTDRFILVLPPGGRFEPLPEGEYTVRVTVHPGTDEEESVVAGSYTVE